jgi:hypothetical protein
MSYEIHIADRAATVRCEYAQDVPRLLALYPIQQGYMARPENRLWNVQLNDYQRRNLLWLLNLVGYGAPGLEPFTLVNNGDWVGEVALKLADERGSFVIDEDKEPPNGRRATVAAAIEHWAFLQAQDERE